MNTLTDNLQNIATEALTKAIDNPTRDGVTGALENALDRAVVDAAKAANPLAGLAVQAFAPAIMHNIAVSLVALFEHIGASIPEKLSEAVAHLEPYVKVDLNNDGKIGP